MLKAIDFSRLWVSWVSFVCWFFVFLSCYYFFLFFYFCITATTWTTTTKTSNNINEGKGAPKTSYKLWSFELWNFRGREEWAAPKLVLLPALGFGNTHTHTRAHTHTQGLITVPDMHQWCNPTYTCFPCTWVLRLASWLCTLVFLSL